MFNAVRAAGWVGLRAAAVVCAVAPAAHIRAGKSGFQKSMIDYVGGTTNNQTGGLRLPAALRESHQRVGDRFSHLDHFADTANLEYGLNVPVDIHDAELSPVFLQQFCCDQ